MKKFASTSLIACALLLGFGCNQKQEPVEEAQEANEARVEDTEMEEEVDELSEFMTEAASGGMMEVELGKMAQEKAQNQQVKDFAAMMVKDHTSVNNELRTLAAQKNIILPDSMSKNHMDHITELRDKTGRDFDMAYMDLMVSDHEEDVEHFEEASNDLMDAEAKAFAAKTLTALRQHHEKARQIKEMLDKQK